MRLSDHITGMETWGTECGKTPGWEKGEKNRERRKDKGWIKN